MTGTLPDCVCLDDAPHPAHEWHSLFRRWTCPGRSIPADARRAGQLDPMIDGEANPLPVAGATVVDRIQAADQAPPPPIPQFFMLDRTDVHLLALRLSSDSATIARLRDELERVGDR